MVKLKPLDRALTEKNNLFTVRHLPSPKPLKALPREAELSAHVSATFTLPMSTKKRARPSPAADSAEPEIDDAALRKALGDKKRAK